MVILSNLAIYFSLVVKGKLFYNRKWEAKLDNLTTRLLSQQNKYFGQCQS